MRPARYAETVRDRALLRETLATARKVQELVETPSAMKGAEILDRAQTMLARLAQIGVRREPQMLHELMVEFVEAVDQRSPARARRRFPRGGRRWTRR